MRIQFDKKQTIQNLTDALEGTGYDIVESMQSKLTSEHGAFTSVLKNNIDFRVEKNGTKIELIFSMPEHGKYLEWGTPPHFPWDKQKKQIPESLADWADAKFSGTDEKGNKMSKDQKAYILALHISKHGTKPYPFIRPTMDHEFNPVLKDNLKSSFK